jgi:hypothetical protein
MNQLGKRLADLLVWGQRAGNPKWPHHKRVAWRRLVYAGLSIRQSTFYHWLQNQHISYIPRGSARDALAKAELLIVNADGQWAIDEDGFIAFARTAFDRVAQDYVIAEGGDPFDLNHPVYVAQRQMLARAGFVQSDLPRNLPIKRHPKAAMRGTLNLGTRLEVNNPLRWLPFGNPASSYYWLHRFGTKRHELRAYLGMAADWATQTRDRIDITNSDHIRWLYYELKGFESFYQHATEDQIRWVMVKVMADKLFVAIDDWPTERERFAKMMARVKEHALSLLEDHAWAEMSPAKLAYWLEEATYSGNRDAQAEIKAFEQHYNSHETKEPQPLQPVIQPDPTCRGDDERE